MLDASDPQLRASVEITFLSPTSYSINGAGSFTYTSGAPIELNGWRVQIAGAPEAGDRFTIADNSLGRGDNRNAQAISAQLNAPRFDNGTTSLSDSITRVLGDIGVTTRQAQINRDVQDAMYQEAVTQRSNRSGVNLDEEAARLIQYQQSYQAAAKVLQIAQQIFDNLLDIAG